MNSEDEEQSKIAFRRIFDKIILILDGEEPLIAFGSILSFLAVTGYEAEITVPQMKDQLQYFLKIYNEFTEKKLEEE